MEYIPFQNILPSAPQVVQAIAEAYKDRKLWADAESWVNRGIAQFPQSTALQCFKMQLDLDRRRWGNLKRNRDITHLSCLESSYGSTGPLMISVAEERNNMLNDERTPSATVLTEDQSVRSSRASVMTINKSERAVQPGVGTGAPTKNSPNATTRQLLKNVPSPQKDSSVLRRLSHHPRYEDLGARPSRRSRVDPRKVVGGTNELLGTWNEEQNTSTEEDFGLPGRGPSALLDYSVETENLYGGASSTGAAGEENEKDTGLLPPKAPARGGSGRGSGKKTSGKRSGGKQDLALQSEDAFFVREMAEKAVQAGDLEAGLQLYSRLARLCKSVVEKGRRRGGRASSTTTRCGSSPIGPVSTEMYAKLLVDAHLQTADLLMQYVTSSREFYPLFYPPPASSQ